MDPEVYANWGIVDFDWSNARSVWSSASPMSCQETLLKQAQAVKATTPTAKVMIYRNLVKALPWYSEVREKMLDPAYSGWFLKFKDGANGTDYHVPPCTGEKCSDFYHDQEQTPEAPTGVTPTRAAVGDWFIYNNTNDVNSRRPGWKTIVDAGNHATWEGCMAAADTAQRPIFTWWPNKNTDNGTCWLSSDWHTPPISNASNIPVPWPEVLHVSGYKPAKGEEPPLPPTAKGGAGTCLTGVCDCGEGLPCGEYLWVSVQDTQYYHHYCQHRHYRPRRKPTIVALTRPSPPTLTTLTTLTTLACW
jgi:hypothetical protein